MSRKKQQRPESPADAVPDEILAEGSGPVDSPTTVEELADAVDELMAAAEIEPEPDAELEPEPEVIEIEAADADGADPGEAEPAEVAALPTTAVELDEATLERLVEAIVFASDKPVTLQRLRQLTRIADPRRIEQALEALAQAYADRGIALQQVSGGYHFRTNTAYSGWVQQLIAGRPVRLSRAQLETLAIVAYRQPITRPEIDEIRGVDSSATLRLLLDRSLIRVLGKREEVGRPMLYGTTGEFLDFFSLQDLRELPTLREYSELTAESRQVMSDRLGVSLDESSEPVTDPEPEIIALPVDTEVAESTDHLGDDESERG
ncbi:MAG TPA: SMC-Scp complex subunit ScpB [Kofleriaceae bacterium]|nr:SMC-Scp complex subunit ScpB [Kofleriaceae bacterium]